MTTFARKLRRLAVLFVRLSGVLTIAAILGVGGLLWYLRNANAQSDLSQGEWQRLRSRFLQRAADADVDVDSEAPAEAEPAPDATPSSPTSPTPPTRPTRPMRVPEALEPLEAFSLEEQSSAYAATRAKSVLELQRFRRSTTLTSSPDDGDNPARRATLVNLNPEVNAWYLLAVEWKDGRTTHHHLVNPAPDRQDIVLDEENPKGLTFVDSSGKRSCELWGPGGDRLSGAATAATPSPYRALCDEQVTLRSPVTGRRTTLEWATDFLRDNVWNGEQITVFVRESFFQDAYLETAEVAEDAAGVALDRPRPGTPRPARLDPRYTDARIGVGELGLEVRDATDEGVLAGNWHAASARPGVFVSVVRPNLLDPEVFSRDKDVVSRLDEVEQEALVYLVAFDLSRFDVGFAVGTEHPRVDWSERVTANVRNEALPGPDGIAEIDPLVRTGIVPRDLAERAVATFTGGFKRSHGAFRVSGLAERNGGSHYGFIESGAVLSKLQPGLSTLYVTAEGTVEMTTWTDSDEPLLPRIAFARQNGLPIIEPDVATGEPVPGRQVSQWAAGNWSGSQDKKFRTVRAGAAIQETESDRFLIYAYFSSATPSAMARVFQAYDSRYAMLLDMNALEHTYLALYREREGNLLVEHLVEGMEVLDKVVKDQTLPRFLGFADNRDFFYVLTKEDDNDVSP